MMGDLISREAAIDIMQAKGDAALGTPKAVFYSAAHMLETLPADRKAELKALVDKWQKEDEAE